MSKPKQKRRKHLHEHTKDCGPWCRKRYDEVMEAMSPKPPLAQFEAWAIEHEGLHTFYDTREWAKSEADVVGWGGKPIRVKVTVEALEEK